MIATNSKPRYRFNAVLGPKAKVEFLSESTDFEEAWLEFKAAFPDSQVISVYTTEFDDDIPF